MFVLEYCNDPENADLHPGNQTFTDSFEKEFDKEINSLDRFIYLIDMFRIIESCSEDLVGVTINNMDEFWKINKCLLNYVNSVYSYKEFINSYDPPLKRITEDYYRSKKWYRFVCDYRNRVIHQSTIIKDYARGSMDIFVDLDEVIEIQESFHFEKESQRRNSERFAAVLVEMKKEAKVMQGKHFLSMKYIAKKADSEISAMRDEVLLYAYRKGIKPVLEWFISFMPIIEGTYQYVFIVDKNRLPDAVYEPNYVLEDFVRRLVAYLGKEHVVCKEIIDLLTKKQYNYFYDGNCDIDNYIQMASTT